MTSIVNSLPLDHSVTERLSDPQLVDQPLCADSTPPHTLDPETLKTLDFTNPSVLRPTLATLTEVLAHRFDPVRFRFIEALARRALDKRASVALIVEKKALRALSGYLNDYFRLREHAAALVTKVLSEKPERSDEIRRMFDAGDFEGVEKLVIELGTHTGKKQGVLNALTQEILQRRECGELVPKPSFEEDLRRQELEVMRSVAGVTTGSASGGAGGDQVHGGSGELSTMGHFRESLIKRNSEKLVIRSIQEGPENPGPLNPHALMIRSLSTMRDLSPSYSNRFVSYMDTLLWLGQAGGSATPRKAKGTGRRRRPEP